MIALHAVAGAEALEAVPLHDAREALALAGAGHVDHGATGEHLGGDLLADRVLARVGGAQLGEHTTWGEAGFREVARFRLVDLARIDRAEGQLYGLVAVLLLGAH